MTNGIRTKDHYRIGVATADEFRSSREAWNRLVASMAQPSVFLTWEWIYTWWEHFRSPQRELLILFVRDGEELQGILPLYREGGIGGDLIWFCSACDLYPDHLDIIAAPEHAGACLAAVQRYFYQHDSRWAAAQFPMVTEDSGIYRWLCGTGQGRGRELDVEASQTSVANYIPLEDSFDAYFAALDKKQRYNVRSRRKRLYEEEGVQYRVRAPSNEGLAQLFELHRRRAERKGIVSSFGREEVFAFHRTFIERAAPNGWVYFRFLEGSQGAIAAAYNLVYAGRVYSYQKGIDPAWERHGPGTVLLYELVQEAFAQGLKEYNFLQGGETYKNEWTRHARRLYTLRLYNRNAAGRLAACLYRSKQLIKRVVGRK